MSELKAWLALTKYRFTISNRELRQCQRDRRCMDDIRRKMDDCARRMELHEANGGCCSINGGQGVAANILSFPVLVYRSSDNGEATPITDSQNKIVVLDSAKRQKLKERIT